MPDVIFMPRKSYVDGNAESVDLLWRQLQVEPGLGATDAIRSQQNKPQWRINEHFAN